MTINLNTFSAYTKIESTKVNQNFQNIVNKITPAFVFTVDDVLSTGTSKTPVLIVPNTLTIDKVYATVKTAPTGQSLILDINKNGTSIWDSNQGNRITIGSGSTYATQTAFDTTALVEGDLLTLDIDQIGSTIAGESLTIILRCS